MGEAAIINPKIVRDLAEISEAYDVVLCDVWGCYHNGVTPFPAAVAALQAYRRRGGVALLLTNAPRPHDRVRAQLGRMGAPEDSYDGIVTSGDATRAAIEEGAFGRRYHIVGPSRDDDLWRGLDLDVAPLEAAEAILCTGLLDDTTETPADYADLIAAGVARDLPFLCANPDLVVDRGAQRLYCAGAIAQAYAQAGGRVTLFGKPHAPIYRRALERARGLRPDLETSRVLAIGDGVLTDVRGSLDFGLDCLFVTGGLAAAEVGEAPEAPDPRLLAAFLTREAVAPRFAIGRLR